MDHSFSMPLVCGLEGEIGVHFSNCIRFVGSINWERQSSDAVYIWLNLKTLVERSQVGPFTGEKELGAGDSRAFSNADAARTPGTILRLLITMGSGDGTIGTSFGLSAENTEGNRPSRSRGVSDFLQTNRSFKFWVKPSLASNVTINRIII